MVKRRLPLLVALVVATLAAAACAAIHVLDPETRDLDDDARKSAPGAFVKLSDGYTHYEVGGPESGDVPGKQQAPPARSRGTPQAYGAQMSSFSSRASRCRTTSGIRRSRRSPPPAFAWCATTSTAAVSPIDSTSSTRRSSTFARSTSCSRRSTSTDRSISSGSASAARSSRATPTRIPIA